MNKSCKSSGGRFKRLIVVSQTLLIITLLHIKCTGALHVCVPRWHVLFDMWMHIHVHGHTCTCRVSHCLRKQGTVWCHSNQSRYPTLLEQDRGKKNKKKKQAAMTDWQDPNEMLDTETSASVYLSVCLSVCVPVWLSVCLSTCHGDSMGKWKHQNVAVATSGNLLKIEI